MSEKLDVAAISRYVALTVVAVVLIAPLLVMWFTSLKGDEFQIVNDLGGWRAFLPSSFDLTNYEQVLADKQMPFARFLLNTIIVVFSIVLCGIVVNSAAAFCLARVKFRGRGLILAVIIALIIVPVESLAIPLLLMVNRLGWMESYHVQVIPFIAHPFSIFLFYQFFCSIPKDLDEAAKVDGAGPVRTFVSIILPLSGPVIATVAILQSLEYWSAYLWPLMTTRAADFRPVSVAVAQYFGQEPRQWGDVMAFATMSSLPVITAYMIFQRWFIQSVAGSAVKG